MGRAPCCDKVGLKKGPWLPEEDQKLIDYIQNHGPGNWRALPKKAGLQRCGKSCRLRWTNYLRPDIKRGRFSFEEEEAIIQLHKILGNKWSIIAAKLPGRTDNEIKNHWNTHIRKRLLREGIDPVTHSRRLEFLDITSILNNHTFPHNNTDHQLNWLKLLGLQSLVNPINLLGVASLLSRFQTQNQNFKLQNLQENNQFANNNNTYPSQIMQNPNQNTTVFDETQVFNSSFENSGAQSNPMTNDQLQDNANMLNSEAKVIYDSDNYKAIMDSLLDTLELQANDSLAMPSLSSTPCSSQQTPTPPLSTSNSPYHPNRSSNTTSNEDEIDSYCQNLMNFDVPTTDFFDNYVFNL